MMQKLYIPPWDISALAVGEFNLQPTSQQSEHNVLWKVLPIRRAVNTTIQET